MIWLLFEFYLSTDIDNIIAVEVGSLLGVFLFLLALTVTVKPLANVVGNRLCEKKICTFILTLQIQSPIVMV